MTETAQITLDADLEFLNLKEVAAILRIAPISVYRLIARKSLPVYRTCRKILFKKQDVLKYLERNRRETLPYGSS
jgi:excisionase family DNA binding protein